MTKKVKILHILPSLTKAGAEQVVFNLLNNLNQNKYELGLILFKDNHEGKAWKQILANKNIKLKCLRKRCLFDFFNFYQIVKYFYNFQPDIVHTHLGGDIYGRLAAKIIGVKIIVSTEHNLNIKENYCARQLKKITAKFAKKIFAVSQAVAHDAIKRYSLQKEQVKVVYNGIDLSNFIVSNPIVKSKQILTIGTLSRLTKQKGLDILIKAVAQIKHHNFVVKIAGQGELQADLEKQIKQLNLTDKVNLVGPVKASDFLSSIDIFVFPSLWEGLGLSLLEAGAMQKVVIASDIDGIKEVVDQESGFLFKAGQVDDLSKQLNQVLDNFYQPLVQEKPTNLNVKVKKLFSLTAMLTAYETWYDKLISEI